MRKWIIVYLVFVLGFYLGTLRVFETDAKYAAVAFEKRVVFDELTLSLLPDCSETALSISIKDVNNLEEAASRLRKHCISREGFSDNYIDFEIRINDEVVTMTFEEMFIRLGFGVDALPRDGVVNFRNIILSSDPTTLGEIK